MSNVLILGCGAREHAIAWKLSASPNVKNVFLAPGNACMYSISGNRKLNSVEEVREFCIENSVFLTVIGPEKEICEGWADELSDICLVFAPNKFCAMLEGSKNFAKNFMIENCLPTAEFQSFDDLKDALNFINEITWKKIVIKEDGLCSGKGVTIATTKNEAKEKLEEIFNYNKKNSSVVIEEFLDGFEVSAMCFTDGFFISRLPLSQDHKKIFEGDLGENTGGMGAIAPLILPKSIDDKITAILQITIDALRARGLLYKGILYAGLMVKADDVYILEYNCRFGDPECEVVLRLLESDLFDILKSCCDETLYNCNIRWSKKHAIGIVMATKGYPQSFVTDKIVSSSLLLNESKILNNKDNVVVFYAGLKKNELKEFVNCGGRVLCVTSVNNNPYTAKLDCLKALDNIHFDLKYFRRDIGHSILFPPKPPLNYCNSGVNVAEGNRFVEEIKEFCKLTLKAGTEQIGGFGAVVDLKMAGFKNPQLVIGMDGVGTKLDIASQINLFDYLGHDLVGMCVNDVLCHASKPVAFLDYYVTGKLNLYNSKKIIKSIANACLESGCSLIGGETAEMPGVYNSNQWDIAGCCIGVRESDWSYLPQLKEIKAGNVLLGLASNGLHSNGFSLVRKILTENNFQLSDNCLWNNNSTLGAELLKPTKIYVKDIFELSVSGKLKAIAHITGGGIIENLPRCLPKNLAAKINCQSWSPPLVFHWLQKMGNLTFNEMIKTFNCGIGMILVVALDDLKDVKKSLELSQTKFFEIGKLVDLVDGANQVQFENNKNFFNYNFDLSYYCHSRINVAIFISGNGSNMVELINQSQKQNSNCFVNVVISNKRNAKGVELAKSLGVNVVVIPSNNKTREDFENHVMQELSKRNIDLICLAGFMRLLTSNFINKWKNRIINIHPSLLPSFKGVDAVKLAIDAGVKVTGCTIHYVVEDVDSGEIIDQEVVRVDSADNKESLQKKIQQKEHSLYPKIMEQIAKNILQEKNS